jgi:hypothetical protein
VIDSIETVRKLVDCIGVSCDTAEFDAKTVEFDGFSAEIASCSAEIDAKAVEYESRTAEIKQKLETKEGRSKTGPAALPTSANPFDSPSAAPRSLWAGFGQIWGTGVCVHANIVASLQAQKSPANGEAFSFSTLKFRISYRRGKSAKYDCP